MKAHNLDPTGEAEVLSDVVQALTSMNCDASAALVERTRCAVREAALIMQEQRIQRRRNMGFALSTVVCLLLLLGPAIWNSLDDLFGGEFADLPSQVEVLLMLLAAAILASLVAFGKEQRDMLHQRRDL